jgi:hypothetical protein
MRRWAALAAVLALAGCGGGSDAPKTSAKVIADAAAKTTDASTARFSQTISAEFKGRDLGDGSLAGAVDGNQRRATMSFDMSFFQRLDKEAPPGTYTGKGIFYGDFAYFSSRAIDAELPAGKRWVLLTNKQIEEDPGPGGSLAGVGTLDPTQPVDHFRALSGDAEELGSERIDGAMTTHYRADLDYRDYLPLTAPSERPGLTKAVEKLETLLGSSEFPIEAWVAEDGTIRRAKGVIDGRGLHMEYTLDLSAIGEPAPIRKPPRRTVVDGRGF